MTKWMLDMTEGPCRMRKKLVPNALFYTQYPYRPDLELAENKSQRYKVATSFDARDHFKLYTNWRTSLVDDARVEHVPGPQPVAQLEHERPKMVDTIDSQLKDLLLRPKPDVHTMADIDEEAELVPGTSLSVDEGPQPPQDWQNLVRLLEENEKIGHLFRCARVQGLETVDGLLLFGNSNHLHQVCLMVKLWFNR